MEGQTQLGKYRLLSLLASGGMGEVYLAKMEGPAKFAKTVVVKKVLSHLARDPNFIEMFLNEARLAAVLTHPNIVQIFELGEQDGTYFIAMEFVNGRSLKAIKQQLLDQKQIVSPIFAARVCAQALNGLHYAHTLTDEEGTPLHVVHRDMSPDNVLVTFGGEVKVVDFGIAKASNAVTTTRTGTLKGKYAYMAPEQLLGKAVDARADIFAVGVMLYELLTGMRPFRASTEPALIQTILSADPKPPHEVNSNVPVELSEVVLKALQKDPRQRFRDAEQMSVALEVWLQSLGQPLTATHIGSLLKQLFPDGDRVSTASNPSVPVVSAPVSGDSTVMMPAPPKPGSSPSLVKPLPKGASSPDLPSASQAAQVASAGAQSPKRVLMIASLAGAGVGLIAAVIVLLLRPAPQVLVVHDQEPVVAQNALGDSKTADSKSGDSKSADALKVDAGAEVKVAANDTDSHPANSETHEDGNPEKKQDAAAHGKLDVRTAVGKGKGEVRKASTKPGKVSLRVNPYAEVFFGGKSLGVTPMPPVEVPSGTQTFTLKNSELKITKTVTVKVPAGGTVTLKADLFDG
ncbi:MAG: serine/threonine protein kinase [Myxococcaceae bacterium]